MTIDAAIAIADETMTNTFTISQKRRWLSELDGQIKSEFLDLYDGNIEFKGYDMSTDEKTELLIKAPYDKLYEYHLLATMYMMLGETDMYNQYSSLFNDTYKSFKIDYNKKHKHVQPVTRYF